jgi:3-oxoacyl-[acyl-carrier protein] reductase
MDLGLTGRACIVSGGSRGIGLEVARQLHDEGADLLLLGRGQAALRAAADGLGEGARVELLEIDITEPGAGDRVVDACQERFGRVDALVNNAGMSSVRAIEELTEEDWQVQWDINVMAPMRLMRAAIGAMVSAGWGRVVNISSSSGKRPGQRNARGGTRQDVLKAAAAGLPIRRLAGPEEIAAVIVFLCSEAASNVAGAAWSVDGGAVPVII